MGKGQDLYKKAKKIIPGGTQLLSKRPEMFLPNLWPAYYKKAKGCYVWDLDGKKYVDVSLMGIGACPLGYANRVVNKAVKKVINNGNMTTLNSPDEVRLAEKMLSLHPWAEQVRYTRSGGEAMSVAVRIARASTGKDIVLFCGYHGWTDWYLSANLNDDKALDGHLIPGLNPLGVPRGLKGTSFPFFNNDTKGFLDLAAKYGNQVGAVVMESVRNEAPAEDFLNAVSDFCENNNIPLVIDEVTAGFRENLGGAHLKYGIKPDIAVFAKGISNGFPMAVIIGKKKYMDSAQESFISSTYWTEGIGPAAALAAITEMEKNSVQEHLVKIGSRVQNAWKTLAEKNKIEIKISGLAPLSHFDFIHQDTLYLKTLFTQLMLERGYIASNSFYISYAHKDNIIKKYISICDEVFAIIGKAIKENTYRSLLKNEVCHSGFKRLN
jgi:glutamate-1-semialdehyde aminotransferase